jgi:hypothetical protein
MLGKTFALALIVCCWPQMGYSDEPRDPLAIAHEVGFNGCDTAIRANYIALKAPSTTDSKSSSSILCDRNIFLCR